MLPLGREAAHTAAAVGLVAIIPLIAIAVVLAICVWVYRDASAKAVAGTPIYVRIGEFRIDSPTAWTISCAVLSVIFIPLYLAARKG